MTKEQAEQIIRNACAAFVGKLADHQAIQQALEVIFAKSEEPTKPTQKPK